MPRKQQQTNETEKREFPTRLRELIEERKITQGDVARGIGLSRQAISLYATGQSEPSFEILSKLADFFEVSADYLLGRQNTQSLDVSVQAICNKTGLSEKALERLVDAQAAQVRFRKYGTVALNEHFYILFINALLENETALRGISGNAYMYHGLKISMQTEERRVLSVQEVNDLEKEMEQRFDGSVTIIANKDPWDFHLIFCRKHFNDFIEGMDNAKNPLARMKRRH